MGIREKDKGRGCAQGATAEPGAVACPHVQVLNGGGKKELIDI